MSTLPYRLAAQMQDNLGASSNFDDAVSISNRLKENMDAEGRCSNECFVEVLAMLSPLQQVRSGPCTCSRPGQHLASSRARPPHNLAALQQSRLAAVHDPRRSAAAVRFTGWRAAQCRVEAGAEEASLGLQARMAVESAPFVWDPCALAELLQAQQQLRTDSDDLRPGSKSLMEQASCLRRQLSGLCRRSRPEGRHAHCLLSD